MAEVKNRMEFEGQFQTALQKLSRKHRQELRELMGADPDPSQIPVSFWQRVQREKEDAILLLLLLIFISSSRQHGGDSLKTESEGQIWARQRANEVASGYVQHSREKYDQLITEFQERKKKRELAKQTVRNDETDSSTVAIPKPITKVEIKNRIKDIFSDSRDEAIAVTETTNASSSGAEWAVKDQENENKNDRWQTEEDARVCPVCSPLNDKKRADWETKFPSGPPAHPNCRCQIIYVNEEQLIKN